jgi:hypothetical protein
LNDRQKLMLISNMIFLENKDGQQIQSTD